MKNRNDKKLKSKILKTNEDYFKFINNAGVCVYSVEYTKDKKIKVHYRYVS